MKLEGYLDANWAQEQPDRKSINGFRFMMAGGRVSWRWKKQTVVLQSSKRAELIALAMCV